MPTQTPELKHTLHRLFLGPLPERVLSAAQHASGKEPRRLLGVTQTQRSLSEARWLGGGMERRTGN